MGATAKPIYHHTLNWGLAIAYMISKGETEKTNGNDFAQLVEKYKGKSWIFTLSHCLPHPRRSSPAADVLLQPSPSLQYLLSVIPRRVWSTHTPRSVSVFVFIFVSVSVSVSVPRASVPIGSTFVCE